MDIDKLCMNALFFKLFHCFHSICYHDSCSEDTYVTLVFSPSQAIPAAKLGVKFVSPFVGWKENSGDSSAYLKEIAKIYKNYGYKTEIIAAAVRNGRQISELAEAGIDIVTCGLAVYEASFEHPFTTHGLGIFREAWDSTATE